MATNDITGARLVSKANTPEYEQGYIRAFGNRWKRHDGTGQSPVADDVLVEIETYTMQKSVFSAGDIDWKLVKYFRVVKG